MIRFALPWPNPTLSPNARPHWAVKAKLTKGARHTGKYVALEAMAKDPASVMELLRQGRVRVSMEFMPPDRRRRDLDNLIASTKAVRDGIADALAMDDSRFQLAATISDTPVNRGQIMVTIE